MSDNIFKDINNKIVIKDKVGKNDILILQKFIWLLMTENKYSKNFS